MAQGYQQYTQAYQKAAVNTVDQGKLIVMLYDGAIKFLTQAADKISKGQQYEAHTNLVKGKGIIAELMASLNMEKGGDIALNLQRLYSYMYNELIDANLNKDTRRLEAVVTLLRELREGWRSVSTEGKTDAAPATQGQAKSINLKG